MQYELYFRCFHMAEKFFRITWHIKFHKAVSLFQNLRGLVCCHATENFENGSAYKHLVNFCLQIGFHCKDYQ